MRRRDRSTHTEVPHQHGVKSSSAIGWKRSHMDHQLGRTWTCLVGSCGVRAVLVQEAAPGVAANQQRAGSVPVGLVPAGVFQGRQREPRDHMALKLHVVSRLAIHDLVLEDSGLPVAACDAGAALVLELCPVESGAVEVLPGLPDHCRRDDLLHTSPVIVLCK